MLQHDNKYLPYLSSSNIPTIKVELDFWLVEGLDELVGYLALYVWDFLVKLTYHFYHRFLENVAVCVCIEQSVLQFKDFNCFVIVFLLNFQVRSF